MNGRNLLLALSLMLCWSKPLAAQERGFAGLGGAEDGFAQVRPDYELTFPADHGPHPDFRIEWWYITANLTGADGEDYGLQWTLFRQALSPPPQREGWQSQQVWLGHAALSSKDRHLVAETVGRGMAGQAGVRLNPFEAWIDDWSFRSTAPTSADPYSAAELTAKGDEFAYDLQLRANGPLVRHGQNGFSQKAETGQASHYYSQPFYTVSGTIELSGQPVTVTGTAWLDREWSGQLLAESQTGWDWFSLQLPEGDKLMLFRLRDEALGDYHSGTWISADGTTTPLGPDGIIFTPLVETDVANRKVPTHWRLQIPGRELEIETVPLNPQSWMTTSIPYWEGPIRFSGSHEGVGYLEMTGY